MNEFRSGLECVLDYLSENRKVHISMHDSSGVLTSCESLKLPHRFMVQDCNFCKAAKSTDKGHILCFKCKLLSVAKVLRDMEPYTGSCYLGIHQIVYPVLWHESVVCVIYVGNMILKKDAEKRERLFQKGCRVTGVVQERLEKELESVELMDSSEKYLIAAQIVHDYILRELESANYVKNQSKRYVVQGMIDYCKSSYANNISATLLGKIYFMNPEYMCKIFKKEVGISFNQYLNRIRIEKAKELLKTTEYAMTEIAYKVGYSSDTYFIRMFRRIEGTTPNQYKKRHLL